MIPSPEGSSDIPFFELMKRRMLHRLPHVALMCLALDSWFSGWVITQHRTLTFFEISSANVVSTSPKY